MWHAVVDFADLQDDGYVYHTGDNFPRNGKTASPERISELSGSGNKIGRQLIEKAQDAGDPPKPAKTRKRSN